MRILIVNVLLIILPALFIKERFLQTCIYDGLFIKDKLWYTILPDFEALLLSPVIFMPGSHSLRYFSFIVHLNSWMNNISQLFYFSCSRTVACFFTCLPFEVNYQIILPSSKNNALGFKKKKYIKPINQY